MKRLLLISDALCVLILAVCCGGTPSHAEPSAAAFALTFPDAPVQPGDEGIECLDVLGPKDDTWVSGWRVTRSGAHHVNLWLRTAGYGYPRMTVGACDAHSRQFVFSSSQPDLTEALPNGTALLIPGASVLTFEVHYLNPGQEIAQARASVEFYQAASHEREVSGMSWHRSSTSLYVPPGGTKTVTFSPPLGWETEVVSIQGHMHAHGTLETVTVDGSEVYRSENWADPPLIHPELHLTPQSEIRWSCTYVNDTATHIGWGNAAQTQEMCEVLGLSTGPHWEVQAP